MLRSSLAGLAILMLLPACGGTTPGAVQGPTAASVAVQPGDLPSGMRKCDLSGDIDSFLSKSKTKDPNTYTSTKADWDAAKKAGATAAYTAFYTDSTQHCAQIGSSSSDITTATFNLVVNFAIQFKDEASATKGYTGGTVFGFSASSLKGGGAPVQEGAATGLGPNSILLSVTISNETLTYAIWQHKAFMVILVVLNMDTATAKKVAIMENGRIT